ncbi:major facilitator superfamily transporter [Colletotrichum scovillei]|uniref:Major facilitator superfamily transporter n=1 Tax=Colletotrichum scovillei TaxID=1209932 RepID=A0A9P7RFA3_9PEZI|nr:major facilitator superfamily transporter [Colletotrichum scovillei]KAF4785470.1 major facilitator superfamily transporter [Colletotrichum scovillei]KAG7055094.1 major facilitator superfamily transporter [Colletotrichum scovillei]KAG7074539.1 major facilitator superfamily transporter [Colletotrichum scovillei]KAG7081692.1 major facilitator superfamily transporter [Colletotrichum scovillei]
MTTTSHDPEKDSFPPEETKDPGRGEEQSSSSQSSDSEDEITEIGRRNGDRSRKSAGADADADSEGDGEVEGVDGDPSAADNAPARTRSRASSIRSRALSIVARSKRRGFLAQLTTIPEVDNPYNYTNKTKWTITLIIALAAAVSPMGSSIFYPALTEMSKEFGVTPTITNLSVAFYMLAMAIFPLWWSSFSETLGRRTIYLLSFTLFVLFSILSAVSVNIEMLIVMRLLAGGASASVQAVGAGTIADIWEPRERGRAMSIFYLGPLTGPLLAPIIGGALAQRFGWQSTMWTLAIYGGLVLVMILFCLPETLARPRPVAIPQQSQLVSEGTEKNALARTKTTESVKVHSKKAAAFFKKSFIDPLSVLLYLRFPPVAITVWFAAVTFGALFVVNISVQATLSQAPYGFSELIIGLFYFPAGLGYFLASLLGGRWLDVIMAREARKAGRYDPDGKLILLPEDRMRENIWIAATVYPASLIYYGWVVEKGLFWFVPCIGLFTFGASSMLVFGAATTMLTEFMPKRSSGGVAVNNFVRNIFSCIGAIAAQPVINAIGNGWLFTILGIFAWVSGYVCVWTLRKKAPEWRKSMDAALNK